MVIFLFDVAWTFWVFHPFANPTPVPPRPFVSSAPLHPPSGTPFSFSPQTQPLALIHLSIHPPLFSLNMRRRHVLCACKRAFRARAIFFPPPRRARPLFAFLLPFFFPGTFPAVAGALVAHCARVTKTPP